MKSSSKSNQPTPPSQKVIPQFACAVYIQDGVQRMTWNIKGDFPKALVLPGLLMVAGDVKTNLLDKLQPSDDNDRMYTMLEEKVEKQAKTDEVSPESETILRLHPKPTEESE